MLAVSWYTFLAEWRRGECELEVFLDHCRALELGADILDAFLYPVGIERNYVLKDSVFTRVVESVRASGVRPTAISVSNDFGFDDQERREIEAQKIDFGVRLAHAVGADKVRVFAANARPDLGFELAFGRVVEGLTRCAALAESLAVCLCLENHGTLFHRPECLLDVLDELDPEGFGITFDIGNFLLAGVDGNIAEKRLASRIRHVHLKDFECSEDGPYSDPFGQKYAACRLGDGVVDLAPLEELVHHTWTLELEPQPETLSVVTQARDWVRAKSWRMTS